MAANKNELRALGKICLIRRLDLLTNALKFFIEYACRQKLDIGTETKQTAGSVCKNNVLSAVPLALRRFSKS
jgi:hypothetical protein